MTNRAFIREQDCIGCTKCLAVCPTDAIVGAQSFLHTVIQEDCIGCELCVPACPVDCIDLIPMTEAEEPSARKAHFRFLVTRRKERLQQKETAQKALFLEMKNKLRERS